MVVGVFFFIQQMLCPLFLGGGGITRAEAENI